MKTRYFRDLIVWQRAMALTKECYALAARLPVEERFALGSQLRRAAVSVPANIAEGHMSPHRREFARFLGVAHASLMEIECHLQIAADVGYVDATSIVDATGLRDEVSRMLYAMRRTLGEQPAHRSRLTAHRCPDQQIARRNRSQS